MPTGLRWSSAFFFLFRKRNGKHVCSDRSDVISFATVSYKFTGKFFDVVV